MWLQYVRMERLSYRRRSSIILRVLGLMDWIHFYSSFRYTLTISTRRTQNPPFTKTFRISCSERNTGLQKSSLCYLISVNWRCRRFHHAIGLPGINENNGHGGSTEDHASAGRPRTCPLPKAHLATTTTDCPTSFE